MPALTSEIFGLQHFASNYCLVQVMPSELEWQCPLPEMATPCLPLWLGPCALRPRWHTMFNVNKCVILK